MKKKNLIILVLIIIALVIVITIFAIKHNDKNKSPIITIFTSESTTVYTIEYYEKYAIYSSSIGGAGGMIDNGNERLNYNEKIDFEQLKREINTMTRGSGRVIITVDNKKVYTNEDNEVVKKLLKIVNLEYLNPMSILKKES